MHPLFLEVCNTFVPLLFRAGLSLPLTLPTFSVLNPFLFIRGLSCPRSVQTSFTQNCIKLTIPGFPYNLLPLSCGDTGFLQKRLGPVSPVKSGRKVSLLPLGRSCPLQTIPLSDLVGCGSPLQKGLSTFQPYIPPHTAKEGPLRI